MADNVSEGVSGRRRCQRGQATVESVGIIVAIAILLAATAAFLAGGISLPRPPDLIGAIARVLGGGGPDAPRQLRPGIDVPGSGGFVRADHGHVAGETRPPIGRAIDRAAAGAGRVLDGGGIAPALVVAFGEGFADRVHQRVDAVRDDPMGTLLRAVRDLRRAPGDSLRDLPGPVETWRYVKALRASGLREGALRLSRDTGGFSADLLADVGTRRIGRTVRNRGRRPAPRDESPPAPRRDEGWFRADEGVGFLR